MKIKGEKLIEKWRRAKSFVDNRGLGEIGGIVRRAGYDVLTDGFSFCDFYEKGTWLRYYANTYSGPWHLYNVIDLGEAKIKIEQIDPNAEYEVKERISVAEMFERGLLACERFAVCNTNKVVVYYTSFEDADNYARKLCQEMIDSRWNDRDCTRYYETSVRNDAQRAMERGEIRHYPWYNYQNHPHFIAVYPTK